MVPVPRAAAGLVQPAVREGGRHLGHRLHHGRAHGRAAALPRRLRGRPAVRHPEGFGPPTRIFIG